MSLNFSLTVRGTVENKCQKKDLHTRRTINTPVETMRSAARHTLYYAISLLPRPRLSFDVLAEQSRKGSLFTLFLFNPLVAFCYVCSIAVLRSDLWESCQWQVRQILNDCLRVFYDWSRCVGKFRRGLRDGAVSV